MRSCNKVRVPLAGFRPRSFTLRLGLCPDTLGPGLCRKPAKGVLSQLIVLTYIYLCVKLLPVLLFTLIMGCVYALSGCSQCNFGGTTVLCRCALNIVSLDYGLLVHISSYVSSYTWLVPVYVVHLAVNRTTFLSIRRYIFRPGAFEPMYWEDFVGGAPRYLSNTTAHVHQALA